jgi:hypothetical protein
VAIYPTKNDIYPAMGTSRKINDFPPNALSWSSMTLMIGRSTFVVSGSMGRNEDKNSVGMPAYPSLRRVVQVLARVRVGNDTLPKRDIQDKKSVIPQLIDDIDGSSLSVTRAIANFTSESENLLVGAAHLYLRAPMERARQQVCGTGCDTWCDHLQSIENSC